jgi:amino acid transporter
LTKRAAKGIGLLAAASIGVGGMIGGGIFSMLGVAAQSAGNAIWIAFIIAGAVALLCVYSYARLGATFPSAGGPVEFLVRGFGDGVTSGGLNLFLWVGYVLTLALYARAFGGYASTFLSTGPSPFLIRVFGTGVIVLFAGINFIGAKAVGRSELVIVVVKVAILLLFSVVGFFFVSPGSYSPSTWPSAPTIFLSAGVIFLAYEGFGLITNAAEDMVDPQRMVPRALYVSILFTIGIYVLVTLAVIGNLSVPKIVEAKDYALAAAAKPFLGDVGFKLMAIAALFSTSSAINATLFGGANVSYTIARDGELPEVFDRKIWRHGTEGLLITTGLVIVFANGFDLQRIAMMGSASFLVIYSAVNFAHLRLLSQTRGRKWIVWTSIVGNVVFLGILIRYLFRNSPAALWTFVGALAGCFAAEWIYRRVSGRRIKPRHPAPVQGAQVEQQAGGTP